MNDLQRAWRTLGVEPGSSREAVERRYKRLVLVWHPDRFPSQNGKLDAEEELKKINTAKDLLFAHLDSGEHSAKGCACQEISGNGATDGDEELAKKRDQERRRSASQARTADDASPGSANSHNHTATAAQPGELEKHLQSRQDLKMRWQVSGLEILVFIAITVFGLTGYQVKSWWHNITWKWQNEHSSQKPSVQVQPAAPPRFVEPYEIPPYQQRFNNNQNQ